ncbi:MAG: NADH-quinone oxidoreductase subunit N [Vicinamibacterales bacterium]
MNRVTALVADGSPLALEAGVFLLSLLALVIGTVRRGDPRRLIGGVVFVGLALLFGASFAIHPGEVLFDGVYRTDELALFAKRLFLGASALTVLASLALEPVTFSRRAAEYHFALLVSLLGMLVLASARELILLFVAFELMSIPLYFLTGFLKREPTAAEAALKFLLVGTLSSAIILYGISFVYGVTGSTDIASVAPALRLGQPLLGLGLALTLAGLGFKIAAVPFHMWVPDAYEAATTPFVAWLSVAPKAAGFVVIFRLYLEGVGPAALLWLPGIAALAALTIGAGNLMALPQRNIKRLFAYSGIAHIGYILMGVAAFSRGGTGMVLFYLVAYLFGNMGAFFVIQAVGAAERSDSIEVYRGLAQRSPVLGLSMLLFLLSLGGIPFLAGFWAKLYVFWAAVDKGMYWLAFLGALLTVLALYYYLLVARRMYIDPPQRPDPVRVPGTLKLAIGICVAGVVAMGAYPEPWVREALRIAGTLF